MQQIDIDFEVFKELTARRRYEAHTYNEVIRELLDIDSGVTVCEKAKTLPAFEKINEALGISNHGLTKGFLVRGLFLPNGTLLRATHKGVTYEAKITNGSWVNDDGTNSTSPSNAATAITKTNVNGWRFWQAKRPSDSEWRHLDMLPKSNA